MTNYIERYWRDAKPEDAIKEPPMVARFRNNDIENWNLDNLIGIDRGEEKRWICGSRCTIHCQVYDAPDPGEGWRLIDVDSDAPQEGDQYYDAFFRAWRNRSAKAKFPKELFCRRRIAPPEPKYVPFTWEDRSQLRGRWIIVVQSDHSVREQQIDGLLLTEDSSFYIAQYQSDYLLANAVFLDTGEPVGKKVQ